MKSDAESVMDAVGFDPGGDGAEERRPPLQRRAARVPRSDGATVLVQADDDTQQIMVSTGSCIQAVLAPNDAAALRDQLGPLIAAAEWDSRW